MLTSSGVLYYEIEIVEALDSPQVGFATSNFKVGIDKETGNGIGDDEQSWGFDGDRRRRI